MSTITANSDTAALQASPLVRNRVDGDIVMGKIRIARGLVSTTDIAAAGDIWNIVQLPKGSVVIPSLSRVECEALGTGVSVKIGDNDGAGDDDRYSAAFTLATAGTKTLTSGVSGLTPYATTSDQTWIQATVVDGGSISITTNKHAIFLIAYLLP